ncbi:hypothetical protein E3T43_07395 [Cryobacterium sp. Hh7]|uniref:hypothetical protein n=1 Tax=Cryobacterium sp. Hh7 TaxID=1259159 RepID=UPI00106C235D|nr:hypothetical protein [Cryobacterium sp. Hh7]TFD58062.1 hypothetical protein E3T43_07395 [Cryobacterium sp. Hh7]
MTRRIRTTRQARRLRHKASLVVAKRKVDALHAEWFWAAVAAAAVQLDNWAVGRAGQIQAERAEAVERAEIKGEQQ